MPAGLAAISHVQTGRFSGHLWEQIDLPLFAGRDPVISLCNTGPVAVRRTLTCVHDANVWLAPGSYSRAFRSTYRVLLPSLLRGPRSWITVSRHSEAELLRIGVARRPAAAVTPCGSDHAKSWDPARSRLKAADLPSRFVFGLASRSPAKNTGLLAELARRLAPAGISVVAAGSPNARVFGAPCARAPSPLVELGRVSDDDIALLMSRAICFVFPSRQEGFGLPPLEAMALGSPVVASDRAAMPEVLGDAAILLSPDEPDAFAAAILRLAADRDARADLIRRGRERAACFAWRDSAAAILDLAAGL